MLFVEVQNCHTLGEGEYTIKSDGFMGSKHVLFAHTGPGWISQKSFLGDDDLRRKGGPIIVIMIQRWFHLWSFDFKLGKPEYIMVQDGNSAVSMIEGTGADIKYIIMTDRKRSIV